MKENLRNLLIHSTYRCHLETKIDKNHHIHQYVGCLSLQKIKPHMNKTLKQLLLASLLGAGGIATAHAGLLSYQGVTFSSTWSGNVLTLEIDAANRNGDWTRAKGLAALELNGIGNYTGVSVTAAPGGASGWSSSSSELNASGCSGDTNGQAGSRLCFYGQQIALADNMVFSFAFSGSGIQAVDPHVKVEFVNAKGRKVGSLLSQTLPASPAGTAGSGTQAGSNASSAPAVSDTPAVPVAPAAPVMPVTPAEPVAIVKAPATDPAPATPAVTETGIDPAAITLVVEVPTQNILPVDASAGTAGVPEPESIALLLGGLGLMGLVVRRKPRP